MRLKQLTLFKIVPLSLLILVTACNSGGVPSSASSSLNWTWMNGSNQKGAPGVYSTKGIASSVNTPGSRNLAVNWVDSKDNFWLFGGSDDGVNGYNDLWEYNKNTLEWTWVGGESTTNTDGIYGTLGVMSPSNMPGSRFGGVSSTDTAGNLWLFGGFGYAESGNKGNLNDLWMYSESLNQWVWVSGSSTTDALGVYGTKGVPAINNIPGSRIGAVMWADNQGDLWLFGGSTTFADTTGAFNDLWKYNISSGEWTWISGSDAIEASGVYGTLGVAGSTTVPGARLEAMNWMDSSGNLWLFGGQGIDGNSKSGSLNDLWSYNPSLNQWTWMSGSSQNGALGVYGNLGVSSSTNVPGSRHHRILISNAANSNTFYMFGGFGYAFVGGTSEGDLNDLWSYSTTSNQWTWLGDSSQTNALGSYGQLTIPSTANVPGSRQDGVGFVDNQGNLWIFGGLGYDSSSRGYLNDLWLVQP